MSKQYEKKYIFKPKDEEQPNKYGFSYDKNNITYRTEIPELPVKNKSKPDESNRDRQVEKIQEAIRVLKDERKEKKDRIKELNKGYDEQIANIKADIELGRKCIEVLERDLQYNQEDIGRASYKIKNKRGRVEEIIQSIRDLRPQQKQAKWHQKNLEEMNNSELLQKKQQVQIQLSKGNFNKKGEAELNAVLTRIDRLRADATRKIPQEPVSEDNSKKIGQLEKSKSELDEQIKQLLKTRAAYFSNEEQITYKIQCIKEDIQYFIEKVKKIVEEQEQNDEAKELTDAFNALKVKINEQKEKIALIQKEFDEKVKQFEFEQEKIKWINWAIKVQNQKKDEWEEEKAERKKQKLREKAGDKKEGQTKPEESKEEGKPQRKKINRNQKEIDNCAFLIEYCRQLIPKSSSSGSQAEKKQVNIQDQIKKGGWAKEKGIAIIQPKKKQNLDDEQANTSKYHRRREEPKEQQVVQSGFKHTFTVSNLFESAKIIPPTKAEQIQPIIKQLQDKIQYYLSHPDEGVDRKFQQSKKFLQKNIKPTTNDSKYTKSKPTKTINSDDFPSLS